MPRPLAVVTAFVLACGWSSAPPAHATSYVSMADAALADQSPLIVDVEVLERVDGAASTQTIDYRVHIVRSIKGVSPPEILVRVPGGTRADGSRLRLHGAPHFQAGERALLFLHLHADGSYRILQFMLGAFHVRTVGGRPVAERDLSEARAVGPPSPPEGPRDLDRFVAWLRDHAHGRSRPVDYQSAPASTVVVAEPFTLLGPSRWTQFDSGGNVPWRAHQNGQSGMAGGGFARFQSALAAWNDDPDTPINLPNPGTTDATGGLEVSDGVNAILFDDPFGDIAGSFSCTSGGVLAVGGFWGGGTVSWKGQTFTQIFEGDIVTQDGAGCFFGGHGGEDGEEVFAHELGHTLGLGHSCGDADSGSCNTMEKSEALMRASAHGDGRGALLGNDDRSGIIFLYGPVQVANVRFAVAASAVGEAAGTAPVSVVLSTSTGALSSAVTVNWATAGGSAAAGTDFMSASGTVTFPVGTASGASQALGIAILDDNIDEADEAFSLTLSGPVNASLGTPSTHTVTIVDDDPAPAVTVSDVTVTEGNAGTVNAVFGFTLSRPSSQTVLVNWTTSDVTAMAPSDYAAGSGQLSFTPGQTAKTVTVVVNGDVVDEPNEEFRVIVTGTAGATQADGIGQGFITDDDPTPQITIQDCTAAEGNSGTVPCTFNLTLSGPSSWTVSASFATANGTAQAPSDFAQASGTVSFAPGQTATSLIVPVNGDLLDESDEAFFVNLSNSSAATIADGQGQATITDDDTAAASVSDASELEGVTGPNTLTFVISLSNPSVQTVTVPYSTAVGSATVGSDYVSASGTVTFLPGEVSDLVPVRVFGDTTVEGNETVLMNLGTPTNAALADGQGIGTIVNDDPPTASALADFIMPGQIQKTTVSDTATTRWFKVRLVPGRSYSASAWAPDTDPSESPVSLDLAWFQDDGATAAEGVLAAENEPVPDSAGHDGAATSILPTAQCAVPTGCTYRLRLQATSPGASISVRVLVVETTLASSYWAVVTAAGYDAAPQIRNNTPVAIPVTFTAYSSAGSVVCTSTFTVPAHGLATFGISGGAPGCSISNGFGSAQLAFHGPASSITANVTTFSALSGLSFDASFRPRNTWTTLHTR